MTETGFAQSYGTLTILQLDLGDDQNDKTAELQRLANESNQDALNALLGIYGETTVWNALIQAHSSRRNEEVGRQSHEGSLLANLLEEIKVASEKYGKINEQIKSLSTKAESGALERLQKTLSGLESSNLKSLLSFLYPRQNDENYKQVFSKIKEWTSVNFSAFDNPGAMFRSDLATQLEEYKSDLVNLLQHILEAEILKLQKVIAEKNQEKASLEVQLQTAKQAALTVKQQNAPALYQHGGLTLLEAKQTVFGQEEELSGTEAKKQATQYFAETLAAKIQEHGRAVEGAAQLASKFKDPFRSAIDKILMAEPKMQVALIKVKEVADKLAAVLAFYLAGDFVKGTGGSTDADKQFFHEALFTILYPGYQMEFVVCLGGSESGIPARAASYITPALEFMKVFQSAGITPLPRLRVTHGEKLSTHINKLNPEKAERNAKQILSFYRAYVDKFYPQLAEKVEFTHPELSDLLTETATEVKTALQDCDDQAVSTALSQLAANAKEHGDDSDHLTYAAVHPFLFGNLYSPDALMTMPDAVVEFAGPSEGPFQAVQAWAAQNRDLAPNHLRTNGGHLITVTANCAARPAYYPVEGDHMFTTPPAGWEDFKEPYANRQTDSPNHAGALRELEYLKRLHGDEYLEFLNEKRNQLAQVS